MKPKLRQFSDLRVEHFEQHPVWASCHVLDYDEPWYDDTDEETFRPWIGPLPVGPDAMFLVAATFVLADGTEHRGFLTPANVQGDLGIMQPSIFAGAKSFGFWEGMIKTPKLRGELYAALQKTAEQVFPVRFRALPGLGQGCTSGELTGFASSATLGAWNTRLVQWER